MSDSSKPLPPQHFPIQISAVTLPYNSLSPDQVNALNVLQNNCQILQGAIMILQNHCRLLQEELDARDAFWEENKLIVAGARAGGIEEHLKAYAALSGADDEL